jgi:hypothetical protein
MRLPELARAPLREYHAKVLRDNWPEYETLNIDPRQPKMNIPALPFVPSWDMIEGDKRLMLLSAHLERADDRHGERYEPRYNQRITMHDCGTPACALGHYAAMSGPTQRIRVTNDRPYHPFVGATWDIIGAEFQLTHDETDTIFESSGCACAQSSREAAAFIRRFVFARHFARKVLP